MTLENEETKELLVKARTIHNLIIMNMQIAAQMYNRFDQKRIIDTTINLAKKLNEIQDELAKRGIYSTQ